MRRSSCRASGRRPRCPSRSTHSAGRSRPQRSKAWARRSNSAGVSRRPCGRTMGTISSTRGSGRSRRPRNSRHGSPRSRASSGMGYSSGWWTSSSSHRTKASGRLGLRERLELLAVRFDAVDLRLLLAVDLREDLGPGEAQPVRVHGAALTLLLDVPLVDPFPAAELLHRDADLRLPQPRGLLDLDRRRLVALREEHERLRDVPREARLNEQVHQGLVPPAEADFPAHSISPPFINLAIYICCDSTVEPRRGPRNSAAPRARWRRSSARSVRASFSEADPARLKYHFPSVSTLGRPP